MKIPDQILAALGGAENIVRLSNPLTREGMSDAGSGGFRGVANVMGRMDSYHSVIFPGAFRKVAEPFVRTGCILEGHNWYDREIGMPTEATDTGRELMIAAEFHDDENSQGLRRIVSKRLKAGKTVELSVGFWPDWDHVAEFKNGSDLLDYARGKGADMTLFDTEIINFDGWCWAIPEVADLAEVSIVHRGANKGSQVVEARSAMNILTSRGALAASLTEHLGLVLAAAQGLTERLHGVGTLRVREGRGLGVDHANQVKTLIEELTALSIECAPVSNADISRQQRLRLFELEMTLSP